MLQLVARYNNQIGIDITQIGVDAKLAKFCIL